jgi:hypothetical protein
MELDIQYQFAERSSTVYQRVALGHGRARQQEFVAWICAVASH